MSAYKDLKNLIDSLKRNPSQDFHGLDMLLNKIISEDQSELVKSMDLVENFLIETLDNQRTLKSAA